VAVGVFPGLEMVADEDRFESGLFRLDGKFQQGIGCELLGRGLVTEAHAHSPKCSASLQYF
jgi:hypothetical protein